MELLLTNRIAGSRAPCCVDTLFKFAVYSCFAYHHRYCCCSQIDAASAKATVPTDKERILSDIRTSVAARRRVGRSGSGGGGGGGTPHDVSNSGSGGGGGDDDGNNGVQGEGGEKGDGISAFNAALRCLLLLRPLDWRGELCKGTAAAAEAGAWVRSMRGCWAVSRHVGACVYEAVWVGSPWRPGACGKAQGGKASN